MPRTLSSGRVSACPAVTTDEMLARPDVWAAPSHSRGGEIDPNCDPVASIWNGEKSCISIVVSVSSIHDPRFLHEYPHGLADLDGRQPQLSPARSAIRSGLLPAFPSDGQRGSVPPDAFKRVSNTTPLCLRISEYIGRRAVRSGKPPHASQQHIRPYRSNHRLQP